MFTYAYGDEFSDLACMVARCGDQLRIGFYDAEDLSDPAGLLVPWNSRHRYLHVASEQGLENPAIAEMFREVRARHADPSAASFDRAQASGPSPWLADRAEYPAAEALVCLLTGIVVGALFAAALDSTTFGLVLGLVIATTLVWIRKTGVTGAG